VIILPEGRAGGGGGGGGGVAPRRATRDRRVSRLHLVALASVSSPPLSLSLSLSLSLPRASSSASFSVSAYETAIFKLPYGRACRQNATVLAGKRERERERERGSGFFLLGEEPRASINRSERDKRFMPLALRPPERRRAHARTRVEAH